MMVTRHDSSRVFSQEFSNSNTFKHLQTFFGTATDLGNVSLEVNRLIEKLIEENESDKAGETDEEGRWGPSRPWFREPHLSSTSFTGNSRSQFSPKTVIVLSSLKQQKAPANINMTV